MKTKGFHIISFFLIAFGFSSFAQHITSIQPDQNTLVFTFNPSDLQSIHVNIGNDTFVKFISEGSGTTTNPGSPSLPVFQRQIIAETIETIEVLSIETEQSTLKYKILPFSLPGKRDNSNPELNFSFDSLIYSTGRNIPETFYEVGQGYFYSGKQQYDLRFYPVQYNPKSGDVVIIKNAVIRITVSGNRQKVKSESNSNSFTNQMLNSNSFRLSGPSRSGAMPPGMLIVTHGSLINEAKNFAIYKTRRGIKTHILNINDIAAYPEALDIKTRIQQIHDTFGFDHLLIIGDISLVPAFYGVESSLSDHMYSTIEGTDFLPDIAVGRFPVFSSSDGKTELEKTMNYERFPDISSGKDWYKEATVAASNSYLDNSHGIHMCKFFKNEGFDTIDDLRAAINTFRYDLMQKSFTNGRSWVFYIGHGEPTYWSVQGNYSTGSLEYLYNNNMLPAIVSVACYTAKLDHTSISLGERWLSLADDRGAISFIGATELTEFFYSDTLGKHAVFGYFNRTAQTIGAALNYGKVQMYNYFPGAAGSLTEETMQQFLLLGDPTVMPWTDVPATIQTNLKKHLKPGQQTIELKITSDSIPVQGALVCLSSGNFSFYESKYTDSAGNITFEVNPEMNSTYYVSISGYNLVPVEDSIRFDTTNSIINQAEPSNFKIYPNPVNYFCTIESNTAGRLIRMVEITDLNGRMLQSYHNINSYTFTFFRNKLETGIYLLRITDSDGFTRIRKINVN